MCTYMCVLASQGSYVTERERNRKTETETETEEFRPIKISKITKINLDKFCKIFIPKE